MSRKRLTSADPTANAAVGNVDSSIAADLQRRQALREQADAARNERIRRAREAQRPSGGDVA